MTEEIHILPADGDGLTFRCGTRADDAGAPDYALEESQQISDATCRDCIRRGRRRVRPVALVTALVAQTAAILVIATHPEAWLLGCLASTLALVMLAME